MEKNLSGTCMTYAKFSSIKKTCFKEMDRKICCNYLSVNTWLRHPGLPLTRGRSKYPTPLLLAASALNQRTVPPCHPHPFPQGLLTPRKSLKMSKTTGHTDELMKTQCILEVKNGQEAGASAVLPVGVVQPAECSFHMTHQVRAP